MSDEMLRQKRKDRRQRAANGFAYSDAWSFDTYLAHVIAGGCRHLSEVSHGPPIFDGNMDQNVDKAMVRWKGILNEIATGFEDYAINEQASIEFDNAFDLFREYFGALWD